MAVSINGTSGVSGVDGSAGTPALQGTDTNTGISFGTDEVAINTGGVQRASFDGSGNIDLGPLDISGSASADSVNIDSSGRLLVGTSSAPTIFGTDPLLTVASSTGFASLGRYSSSTQYGSDLSFVKSRNDSIGSQTIVQNNDQIGGVSFHGTDGTAFISCARIEAYIDGTPGTNDMPGRLVFSTTADGASSSTERMRINSNGAVFLPNVYNFTTASAANVTIFSGGELNRSTSSSKYKTDIETLEDSYADALLGCRPVWYRSTCKSDNPDYGWWGFIAEEVAEIDPRLVHWKTTEIAYDENGSVVETPCDPEPEGVAYDRFVPHLLNLIKRQQAAIETLEAKVAALEGGAS